MPEPSPRGVLNHLIETCHDGEQGFRYAAELVVSPVLKAMFAELADERQRFATSLLPHAQRFGGEATADGTAGASMHRRWMDVRDRLSGHDERAVLTEVRRGNDYTVLAYKKAVEGGLPATVRELVEQEYEDVKKAHDRIDEMDRAWQVK